MGSTNDERAYELHRAAVGAVTAFYGGMTGVVPLDRAPAEVLAAAGCAPDELVLPLCGLVVRAAQMAAAQQPGATIGDVLALLGTEAVSFPE